MKPLLIDDLPPDVPPELVHLMVDLINLPPRDDDSEENDEDLTVE
jgi:hypothetical protein